MGPEGLEGQTQWEFRSVISEVLLSQHSNTNIVQGRLIWQEIFKKNKKRPQARGHL